MATNNNNTVKVKATRLSRTRNLNGGYAYQVSKEDSAKLKKEGARLYGRGEREDLIFYANKLVGRHEEASEVELYVIGNRIAFARSESEIAESEQIQLKQQEKRADYRAKGYATQVFEGMNFGMTPQQTGKVYLGAKYAAQFAKSDEVVTEEEESTEE